jgi:predicted transposase YdaD
MLTAMKTDHPIYLYLRSGPEAFRVLSGGLQLEGAYQVCSLTIKGLERRLDGLVEPDGHPGPAYVVEFQARPLSKALYNLNTKIGLYGEQHPEREVLGIAVFLRAADIPDRPSWVHAPGSPIRCASLDRVLGERLAREPDNPYLAVFAPLMIDSDAELTERAPALWQTIQQAPLEDEIRQTLSNVLEFWFFERFRGLTAQEIWTMLNVVTPIQETKAYQSIFAEGKAAGKAEGKAEGKAGILRRQLTRRFGALPAWATQRIAAAPEVQLDAWLDGIFDATSVSDLLGDEEGSR